MGVLLLLVGSLLGGKLFWVWLLLIGLLLGVLLLLIGLLPGLPPTRDVQTPLDTPLYGWDGAGGDLVDEALRLPGGLNALLGGAEHPEGGHHQKHH